MTRNDNEMRYYNVRLEMDAVISWGGLLHSPPVFAHFNSGENFRNKMCFRLVTSFEICLRIYLVGGGRL